MPIRAHPVLVHSSLHNLPNMGIPQICFVGRSNAGKSSLINSLVFNREIARASATPGRTRHLFTFDIGPDQFSLVDLPGYGFAKLKEDSVKLRQDWILMMKGIDQF